MPRRFYQRNNFEGSLFSFTKSAVLSHFRNGRSYLIFKVGAFVSFNIGCFVLPPFYDILGVEPSHLYICNLNGNYP